MLYISVSVSFTWAGENLQKDAVKPELQRWVGFLPTKNTFHNFPPPRGTAVKHYVTGSEMAVSRPPCSLLSLRIYSTDCFQWTGM